MAYSLRPEVVKKVLEEALNPKTYDHDRFMYYHLYRNYFNVGSEVTKLTRTAQGTFLDNQNNHWRELGLMGNAFHMPKMELAKSLLDDSRKPYSRKFLREDHTTGLGGEFEMIIRYDGKRIDAYTHEKYQETYNFGRTTNAGLHTIYDVTPHMWNSNYTFKKDNGWVTIID
ncbi:MAG: hypothetical protein AAF828_13250 [Bacteroidota bacterium]